MYSQHKRQLSDSDSNDVSDASGSPKAGTSFETALALSSDDSEESSNATMLDRSGTVHEQAMRSPVASSHRRQQLNAVTQSTSKKKNKKKKALRYSVAMGSQYNAATTPRSYSEGSKPTSKKPATKNDNEWKLIAVIPSATSYQSGNLTALTPAESRIIEAMDPENEGYKYYKNSKTSSRCVLRRDCKQKQCDVQVKIDRGNRCLMKYQRSAHNHLPPAFEAASGETSSNRGMKSLNPLLSAALKSYASDLKEHFQRIGKESHAPETYFKAAASVKNAEYKLELEHYPYSRNVCDCTVAGNLC